MLIPVKIKFDTCTLQNFYYYKLDYNIKSDSLVSSYTFKNKEGEVELIVQYRVGPKVDSCYAGYPMKKKGSVFEISKDPKDWVMPIDYTEFLFVRTFEKFQLREFYLLIQ